MKVLVCGRKHCEKKKCDKLFDYLEDTDVEFSNSACMHMCDDGPNVFTFPDLKMYGHVDKKRLKDIISGNSKGLEYSEEIYDLEINEQYRVDSRYKKTVELFRDKLEKCDDISIDKLEKLVKKFMKKNDLDKTSFTYPVRVALINTIKGPDLPKLIYFLGKNSTIKLFNEYFERFEQ